MSQLLESAEQILPDQVINVWSLSQTPICGMARTVSLQGLQGRAAYAFTEGYPPEPVVSEAGGGQLKFHSTFEVPVDVRIVDHTSQDVECMFKVANSIFESENLGISLIPNYLPVSAGAVSGMDPIVAGAEGFDKLRKEAGFTSDRLNVYFVKELSKDVGVSDFDREIIISDSASIEVLAHEVGHALSLHHVTCGGADLCFECTNLMQRGALARCTLSDGQVFRANFNDLSTLNSIYGRRTADVLECDLLPPECPPIEMLFLPESEGKCPGVCVSSSPMRAMGAVLQRPRSKPDAVLFTSELGKLPLAQRMMILQWLSADCASEFGAMNLQRIQTEVPNLKQVLQEVANNPLAGGLEKIWESQLSECPLDKWEELCKLPSGSLLAARLAALRARVQQRAKEGLNLLDLE
jgi:hypothetical protein